MDVDRKKSAPSINIQSLNRILFVGGALVSALSLLVISCGRFAGSAESVNTTRATYAGCTSVTDGGPYAVTIGFPFPTEAERITILRDDAVLWQTTDPRILEYSDKDLIPGTVYKYSCEMSTEGVRLTGAASPIITVADPLDGYVGCTSVVEHGAGAAELSYQFPDSATKVVIARNGIDVFSPTDRTQSSVVIDELTAGNIYVFTCKVEINGTMREGPAKLSYSVPDPLQTTFFGCRVATPLDAHSVSITYEFPSGIDSFAITRNGTTIYTAPAATTGVYTDTGLAAATQYVYTCNAIYGSRSRPGTNSPVVTTLSLPAFNYKAGKVLTATVGQAIRIAPTSLESFGLSISNCATAATSAALPTGLTIEKTTCAITGTPTDPQLATIYQVVATSAAGNSLDTPLQLKILAGPPTLSYSDTGLTAHVGAAFSAVPSALAANGSPITGCELSNFAVTLPTGLSINPTTCEISGTPTTVTARAAYQIIAINDVGSSSEAVVSLEVAP